MKSSVYHVNLINKLIDKLGLHQKTKRASDAALVDKMHKRVKQLSTDKTDI